MHDIEPYYKWRDRYIASEDKLSPFYQMQSDQFKFTHKIYNYWIHPQWDSFGSETLYLKVLFVDYELRFAVIELIGEWNDCLNNDIMMLKRDLIEALQKEDICKFVLLADNVLNFHGSDDSYYQEWCEEVSEERGWVAILNARQHMQEEMVQTGLQHYINFGSNLDVIMWRNKTAQQLLQAVEEVLNNEVKQLYY